MNSIISKGFWNPHLIMTKGFGKWRTLGGVAPLKPKIPEIPAYTELRFEINTPVEVEMQTNFELINPIKKDKFFTYPMYSPLLRVNNFFLDVDLAVLMNKQLNLPIEQRLDNSKLINILKAI